MADFDKALEYVVENEGRGYETWPQTDQPTNTGIIAADISEWKKIPKARVSAEDVKNLSWSDIRAIYKQFYWDKIRGDEIFDQGIATCVFDTCVVRGLGTGIKYAQRTCNLLGGALVVDGEIGLRTLASLNQIPREKFIKVYENLEAAGYLAIVSAHPEDERYLKGWLNRAKRLFSLIISVKSSH